jgi:hypothetical protein
MELIIGYLASKLAIRHYNNTTQALADHFRGKAERMDVFGQIRQGIAKVVQKATENHVFHEFPECSQLTNIDRLSIKLKDPRL